MDSVESLNKNIDLSPPTGSVYVNSGYTIDSMGVFKKMENMDLSLFCEATIP